MSRNNNYSKYGVVLVAAVCLILLAGVLPIYGIGNHNISQSPAKHEPSAQVSSSIHSTEESGLIRSYSTTNYTLNFTETGLPAGTPWKVSVNSTASGTTNSTKTGTTATISFNLVSAQYSSRIYFIYYKGSGYLPNTQVYQIFLDSNIIKNINFSLNPSAQQPVFVFNGSYANYTGVGTYGTTTFYMNESNTISDVNTTSQSFNVFSISSSSFGPYTSYQYENETGTFANTTAALPGFNVTELSAMNNGNISGMKGTGGSKIKVTEGVYVDVPIGTLATDEVNITNASSSTIFWVDNSSGIIAMVTYTSYSISMKEHIVSTNIPMTKYFSYPVYFTESGLPSGTTWSVYTNGMNYTSGTSTISLSLPNGTYPYSTNPVSGYGVSSSSGSITVNGAASYQYITFSPTSSNSTSTYPVYFNESGLPTGTTWSVNINNFNYNSNTSTISLSLPNGTYSFYIYPVSGYSASPSSAGSITVNGGPSSVFITFYLSSTSSNGTLYFYESGLANGTNWSVTLNTTTKSSTTGSISFTVPAGTYRYRVNSVSGYVANPSSGSESISGGSSSTVFISFMQNTHAAQPVFVFNGSYANYTMNSSYNGHYFNGTIRYKIDMVNLTIQTFNINMTSTVSSSGSSSNNLGTFANPSSFPGLNVTVLQDLNSGTVPKNLFPGSVALFKNLTLTRDVSVTVPAGTFTTDELSMSNTTVSLFLYIESYSGIVVKEKVVFKNGASNITTTLQMVLTGTNTPTSSPSSGSSSGPLGGSAFSIFGVGISYLFILIIVAVIVVVAVALIMMGRKKKPGVTTAPAQMAQGQQMQSVPVQQNQYQPVNNSGAGQWPPPPAPPQQPVPPPPKMP